MHYLIQSLSVIRNIPLCTVHLTVTTDKRTISRMWTWNVWI